MTTADILKPGNDPVNNTQSAPTLVAVAALLILIAVPGNSAGWKHSGAAIIGGFAGFALYHASFGFTSAWRRVLAEGRGAGLRAQFLLIILTSVISYPLIAYGSSFGFSTIAAVAPISIAMIFGAFMFGFGMQFGGGCGSGTLFTAGGGSMRMVITLAAFIVGALMGTYHLPWWRSLPKTAGWSMVENFGAVGALIALSSILALIAWFTIYREKSLHGALEKPRSTGSFLHGPWSPMAGVIAIAIVGIATFLVLGRPWGITSGFALWGAKSAHFIGIDIVEWPYWKNKSALLSRSVFADTTSVMNFGIIAGAMGASALAGKYRPVFRLSGIEIGTAILGGLLMGYGARLAYGCNIGAYLGGLVSGSLHGWVWMIAAFVGSALAIRIKSRTGL